MLSFSCKLVHVYLSVRGILSLLTMKTLIINATLCSISSQGLYCLTEYPVLLFLSHKCFYHTLYKIVTHFINRIGNSEDPE